MVVDDSGRRKCQADIIGDVIIIIIIIRSRAEGLRQRQQLDNEEMDSVNVTTASEACQSIRRWRHYDVTNVVVVAVSSKCSSSERNLRAIGVVVHAALTIIICDTSFGLVLKHLLDKSIYIVFIVIFISNFSLELILNIIFNRYLL